MGSLTEWDTVVAALHLLPDGYWTTYEDLARLAGLPTVTLIERLWQRWNDVPNCSGSELWPCTDGPRLDVNAPWARRLQEYGQELVVAGVLDDVESDQPVPAGHMGRSDLDELTSSELE